VDRPQSAGGSLKPRNLLLGLIAPGRTVAAARFEAETLRRGGKFEVQGKSWKAARIARRATAATESPETLPRAVLDAIGWKGKKW
jgi:hypothetical protein